MKLSDLTVPVLIPAYNEEESIAATAALFIGLLADLPARRMKI